MPRTTLNRRDCLKTFAGVAAGALAAPAVFSQESRSMKRPNIILIMNDDMGYCDLGCYGSEIATPNLDMLAAGGMRFTQFYNTARCCPSRASLLTGLYAHQAGVGDMVRNLGVPAYQGYLNDRCVTIAEALRAAGYRTHMSGKWHVGENRPHWPTDRGFDRYFGLISGASSYWQLDQGRQMAMDDKPWTPPDDGSFYMTDAISDHAVKLIGENAKADKPFFHYVAYTAPHWPLHAHPADIDKYRGKYLKGWDQLRLERHARMKQMGIVDEKWKLSDRHPKAPAWDEVEDKETRDLKMAVYAAQIECMDRGIGRIMQAVRRAGIEQDTLVLFLADNGGCAEEINRGKAGAAPGTKESYTSYGLPWANASNTPLRLFKVWVHEGGISTPLIAYWPGVIAKGGLSKEVGHVIDLMPTCLEAAGAQYPKQHGGKDITPVEGKSLLATLRGGKRQGHEAIYWEHEGHRAIRKGDWKLVGQRGGEWELYNLADDRTETNDLIAKEPVRAAELQAMWDAWAKKVGVEPFEKLRAQLK